MSENKVDLGSAEYQGNRYDSFFREVVTAAWCNKSDGDVRAPGGYFALTTIEASDLDDVKNESSLVNAVFDGVYTGEKPSVGHYLTFEDSDGHIFVFRYELTELEQAEAAYRTFESLYDAWYSHSIH